MLSYFADFPRHYLESTEFETDLEDHVIGRYQICLDRLIPWVQVYGSLEERRVLEIGCGTGSSTAAFARFAGEIYSYDIVASCVDAAARRLRVLGIENAQVEHVRAEGMLDQVRDQHGRGVDVVLLYAVLEHMRLDERIDARGYPTNAREPKTRRG